jgi:hypothetical protein
VSKYEGPDRRGPHRPALVRLDETLLASQIGKLDKLDESVQQLAIAIKQRPSILDLERTRKRLRNQLIATVVAFSLIAAGLLYDQYLLHNQCLDRNSNAAQFRELLIVLTEESNSNPPSRIDRALEEYRDSLKIVEC